MKVHFFFFHLFLYFQIILCNSDFSIDDETSFLGLFIRKKSNNEIYIGKENKLSIYNLDSKSYISQYESLNLNILWKGSIYPLIIESNGEIEYIISIKNDNTNKIIIIYHLPDSNELEINFALDNSGNYIISINYYNNNYFFVYYFSATETTNKYKICPFTNDNCLDLSSSSSYPSKTILCLDFSNNGLKYLIVDTSGTSNTNSILGSYVNTIDYYQNIEIDNEVIITCFIKGANNNNLYEVYCFKGSYSTGIYEIDLNFQNNPKLILENCKFSSFSFYKLKSEKLIIGCFDESNNKFIIKKLDSSLNYIDIKIINNDDNFNLFYSDFIVIDDDRIVSILIRKSNSEEKYYYIGIDYSFPRISVIKDERKTFFYSPYEIKLLSKPLNGNLYKIQMGETIILDENEEIIINTIYDLNYLAYIANTSNTIDSFSYEIINNEYEEQFNNKILIKYKVVDLKIIICNELCKTCEKLGDSNNENCLTCIDDYFNNPYIKGKCYKKCKNDNYIIENINTIKCIPKGRKIQCEDTNLFFIEANRQCVSQCDDPNCEFCQKFHLSAHKKRCFLTQFDGDTLIEPDTPIEEEEETQIEEENINIIEEENLIEEQNEIIEKEKEEENTNSAIKKPKLDSSDNSIVESQLSLENVLDNKDNIVSLCSEIFKQKENKDSMVKIESDDYNINYYPTNISQGQIDKSNSANVELGECENVLRRQYNIPKNENLFIAQLELKDKKYENSPKYQFEVYDSNNNKLDLKYCDEEDIIIKCPIDTNDPNYIFAKEMKEKYGIDIYNINDTFFHDKCKKLSLNGKDMSTEMRIQEIYTKTNECGNCSLKTNFENNKIECNCSASENKGIEGDSNDINSIFDNEYLSMVSNFFISTNVHLFKCYNSFSLSNIKEFYKNVGGILSVCVSSCGLICGIFFIYKQMNSIFSNVFRNFNVSNPPILTKNDENNNENDNDNEDNKNKDNDIKNSNINNIIIYKNTDNNNNKSNLNENDKNSLTKENNNFLNNNEKTINNTINNGTIPKNNNENDQILNLNKKNEFVLKNIDSSFTNEIKSEKKTKFKNLIEKSEIIKKTSLKTFENEEEEFSNEELNEMSDFEDIKSFDKRGFCLYLGSIIIEKQIFFSTIFKKSFFYPFPLRIFMFLFTIQCFFFLNGLFFTEEYINNRYKTKKKLNLIYILKNELSKSVYASIFVLLIGKLLTNFTSISIDYTKLQKSKTNKKYVIQMKNLIFSIKKKFIITIVLIIILNFVFGYFLFIFCCIFENNQLSWVLTTFISIFINFVIPIVICLLITVMRFISLKINSGLLLKISLCIYSII